MNFLVYQLATYASWLLESRAVRVMLGSKNSGPSFRRKCRWWAIGALVYLLHVRMDRLLIIITTRQISGAI